MRTPVLMLTARGTPIDLVMGLRLAAVQPRQADATAEGSAAAGVFVFGPFRLDTCRRELARGGEPIPLNVQEFRLLEVFARNPDRILSRPA